jgi:hypothetical protein
MVGMCWGCRKSAGGLSMTDHSASAPLRDEGVLSIEQVLVAEADAIHGEGWRARLTLAPSGQDAQDRRKNLNHDRRSNDAIPSDEVEGREKLYRRLNELNRAALCCSGGGIRSATFCLGVIQALASHDVRHGPRTPQRDAEDEIGHGSQRVERQTLLAATADDTSMQIEVVERENWSSGGSSGGKAAVAEPAQLRRHDAAAEETDAESPAEPENSLLGRFHYLSTVSGGGYVGSWLSSWRKRDQFDTIIENLTGRPSGADVEPPEISWLRAYSNYLTPRLGIASADTWAAIAIVARNLLLNWLIIIPVLCLVLLALKLIAAVSVAVAHGNEDGWLVLLILAAGIVCLIVAQAFTTRHRPPRRHPDGNIDQKCFLVGDFIWAIASAIAVTIFFASHYFLSLVAKGSEFVQTEWPGLLQLGFTSKIGIPIASAVASFFIYLIGWLLGRRLGSHWKSDWFCWGLSGIVYGALVGFGAYLFSTFLAPYPLARLLVAIIFGVPWVLMSQLTADDIFGGFVSYEPLSDSDREWLGRAAGWLAAFAIAWAFVAFLVFAGGYYAQLAIQLGYDKITASGGILSVLSALVTALLGKSSLTSATSQNSDQTSPTEYVAYIVLAIAGPVFVAILVVALSVALDRVLIGDSLVTYLQFDKPPIGFLTVWLVIGAAVAAGIGLVASWCVNINRFSLHALYRNRLIRGYLGASRQNRSPDLFTGLDSQDNVRMYKLWPPKRGGKVDVNCLFHVINITLNLVSTKRLAWQERKAESFTVTPKHCGSANLGFRPSIDYGDSFTVTIPGQQGIALGTAMAISGAAVSSNMGYASSPSLAILLTLFNVRLGWWLGNPGSAGNPHGAFRREGPRFSALPLLFEALGQTTDDRPYVYLSDGGHFENLGLYEMVRRRCRFIVVIDAGCDPKFTFDDLGNAVRKIYIDLGVRIDFEGLDKLRNRPSAEEIKAAGAKGIPYYAIGTINYVDADGNPGGRAHVGNGYILYIKPAFHGGEGAGIVAYAKANEAFPHETTVDQWFTESQFESYRSLGFEIAKDILRHDIVLNKKQPLTLHQLLRGLQAP